MKPEPRIWRPERDQDETGATGSQKVGIEVPDWREPEEYSYTDGLHVHEWAWEFLRRNSEYRSRWQDYSRRCKERDTASPIWQEAYRWGIYSPADPDVPAPEGMPKWTEWVDSVLDEIEDSEELYGDGIPRALETFTFDLLKPVDPQLDLARIYLQASQKSMFRKVPQVPRFKRENFKTYLRLLDASEAGESIREIGRVLFSDKADARRTAQKMLLTAQAMVAERYQDLLLLAK